MSGKLIASSPGESARCDVFQARRARPLYLEGWLKPERCEQIGADKPGDLDH
jgi:hypothetical protein